MREIQERLAHLNNLYDNLIDAYQKLLSYGEQERQLITEGRTPELVSLLEEKAKFVGGISQDEEEIQSLQQWLAAFFSLERFSLPQLKANLAASPTSASRYKQGISELDEKIRQLVNILEVVEQQERAHEEMLQSYTERLRAIGEGKGHKPQARKAYDQWIDRK